MWHARRRRAGQRGRPRRDLSTAAKANGACPPEDVGGAWGYEALYEALADADHEQHEDMVRWSGGDFDAEDAKIDSIIERFNRLAKKWAPRSSKPKAET